MIYSFVVQGCLSRLRPFFFFLLIFYRRQMIIGVFWMFILIDIKRKVWNSSWLFI